MRKPELLAPAGSFLAAYYALEAGADAIYLGMKEFSARKGAQNFSLDQLRRIRQLALERGRRIYVTVNTVIRQSELERLSESLAWLEALQVDAVIVQDLGACDMIRKRFPGITIHASTQMAVHNEAGLRMAAELGIRRVILPRELPLERIRALHDAVPEMELECFIHGALCYSFSGICLASWSLTGRSSNRGDCAQICRSRFTGEAGGSANAAGTITSGDDAPCGHLFSGRDLFLGRGVLKLAEAGVRGLKVEGRMKSPEYVFNVTKMYRAILDSGPSLPEEEYSELARRVELSFGRRPTTGWTHSSSGVRLIDTEFPGHRGTVLGTVSAAGGHDIGLRVSADLSLRDGIGWFSPGNPVPTIFSVTRIRKGGKEVRFARAGDPVVIDLPADAVDTPPAIGTQIRHMSSRFLDLPQPKEAGFPFFHIPVEIEAALDAAGSLSLRTRAGGVFSAPLTVEKAQKKKPFAEILAALLKESGDSLFVPSRVTFENQTTLADDEIFVPPSQLKKVKNDFCSHLDAAFREGAASRADAPADAPGALPPAPSVLSAGALAGLSDRSRISPPACAPVPFVDADPARLDVASLAVLAGHAWLPLPPVIMEERAWENRLRGAAQEARDRGTALAVGLNNLSHVALAEKLAGDANIVFFVDVYLYAANCRALALVSRKVPRLLFAYAWIEGNREDARTLAEAAGALPVVMISQDFRAPLFYSMGCFARHVLNNGKCYEACPKDFTRVLRQGKGRFQAVVRDCVTWLYKL